MFETMLAHESTFATIDFMKYKFILSISNENLSFWLWCALNVKYSLKFGNFIQKKECKIYK